MRIDYSEPKKSYVSPQAAKPRKEAGGGNGTIIMVFMIAVIMFGSGFGSGWFMSQRSAKKAFKAAMEQQSLENSPHRELPTPPPPKPTQPAQTAAQAQQPQTQQNTAQAGTAPSASGTGGAPEPPLSFYKTLPSGQKNAVLGSGINSKDEKSVKQPLQAAMPSNMSAKPVASPQGGDSSKQGGASSDKPPARQDATGFTVQVASYSLKSEAEALRTKLSAKGYNVVIAESNQGEKGVWFRVRVGKGLSQDAAKELASKLGKGALAVPERD